MTNRNISFIIKDQNPLMLRPTDTVQTACRGMCERSVGAVLVTDARGHLKGIFTGRDAVQVIASGGDPARVHLGDVMTAGPDTIAPERKAIDALHMMCDGGYRHLPVVDDGKVVGIVSRSDFKGPGARPVRGRAEPVGTDLLESRPASARRGLVGALFLTLPSLSLPLWWSRVNLSRAGPLRR